MLHSFLTNMNVFTRSRGRDRRSLVYRPFTIEEEVTFSEAEDVSPEEGKIKDRGDAEVWRQAVCLFVHEPTLWRGLFFFFLLG